MYVYTHCTLFVGGGGGGGGGGSFMRSYILKWLPAQTNVKHWATLHKQSTHA